MDRHTIVIATLSAKILMEVTCVLVRLGTLVTVHIAKVSRSTEKGMLVTYNGRHCRGKEEH